MIRPERSPFDLANIGVRANRVERVLDRLWSDRLVSDRTLQRVLANLPRRGFQVDLGDDNWIGCVDFVGRQRRGVIDVQSERHHGPKA